MPNKIPFKSTVSSMLVELAVSGPVLANNMSNEVLMVLPDHQVTPLDEAAMFDLHRKGGLTWEFKLLGFDPIDLAISVLQEPE